jgi:hypothetical protein
MNMFVDGQCYSLHGTHDTSIVFAHPMFKSVSVKELGVEITEGRKVSDTEFCHLINACPNLERLCMTNLAITDKSLETLSMNCTRLESLMLVGCEGVSVVGLLFLCISCPMLNKINLYGIKPEDADLVELFKYYLNQDKNSLNIKFHYKYKSIL